MPRKLVKLVKVNHLQYNPNRDPQFYRRTAGQTFHVQALLDGSGTATASFAAEGKVLCEQTVTLPGRFDCSFSFETPGTRVGTLTIAANGKTYQQDIRLDVEAHAWVG